MRKEYPHHKWVEMDVAVQAYFDYPLDVGRAVVD